VTTAASASARRSGSSAENASQDAASDVANSKWGERGLRFGIGARAFVFLVIAYLVARIATGALGGGGTKDSASGPGAAQAIQQQTGGDVALVLLGVGMLLFALFCVVDAVRNKGNFDDSEAKVWAKRGLSLWQAAIYLAFGIYCFVKVISGSSSGSSGHSNRRQSQWSAEVLRWPAGWLWLGLLGVALFVVAGVQVYRAVKKKFRKQLEEGRMTPRVRSVGTALGVAGFVGRGAAYALVGWFVLHAAFENDPKKGKGVDGSARMLANSSGGPVLLWVLAALLFAFGLYLFVEARYRKI
jgi:Mn2+/Fe2+ NRAMP family transporter